MNNFDSIIILGDSWSWGAELPEDQRTLLRFDHALSNKFELSCVNLSRESASNFCYKWHWLDYISSNKQIQQPLVIVGITGINRHLIWNNQADFFQESQGRLLEEKTVLENWTNQKGSGGFIRAFPYHVDFPNPTKKRCQDNFYRYNYDDKMAEIYSIWEIKLLDLMIKDRGGFPVFWSNFQPYQQIELPWAKTLLNHCKLVNALQPFAYQSEHFYRKDSHPNEAGHAYIADILYQNITG